jgi:hypothetical protein
MKLLIVQLSPFSCYLSLFIRGMKKESTADENVFLVFWTTAHHVQSCLLGHTAM